jgi:hypothetical protein
MLSVRRPVVKEAMIDRVFAAIALIIVLQYQTLLISSVLLDRLLKISLTVLLWTAFRYRRPQWADRPALLLYLALLSTALMGALAATDLSGIWQLAKYASWCIPFTALLLRSRPRSNLQRSTAKVLIAVGVLFSLQGAALVVAVSQDWLGDPSLVTIEKYANQEMQSFGLLGLTNAYGYTATGRYVRAQSWFTEASSLAGFLLPPTFLAWGLFRQERRRRYLLASALCFTGVAATFSLAASIGMATAFVVATLVRTQMRRWPRALTIGMALVSFAFAGQAALWLLDQSHTIFTQQVRQLGITPLARLIGRDPTNPEASSLIRDAFHVESSIALIKAHPFGVGLGFTGTVSEVASPNPVVFWGIVGGIPALGIILGLHSWLFFARAMPALLSKDALNRSIAAAYVALTVHNLSNGNWISSYYLVVVAMLLLTYDGGIRLMKKQRIRYVVPITAVANE